MRFGEIGSERDGPIETLDRFFGPIEVAQRVASIDPRIEIFGRCIERAVIIGKRVSRAIDLDQRVAAIVVAFVLIELERKRAIARIQRRCASPFRISAVAMRLGKIRPNGHSAVVVRERRGKGSHRIVRRAGVARERFIVTLEVAQRAAIIG